MKRANQLTTTNIEIKMTIPNDYCKVPYNLKHTLRCFACAQTLYRHEKSQSSSSAACSKIRKPSFSNRFAQPVSSNPSKEVTIPPSNGRHSQSHAFVQLTDSSCRRCMCRDVIYQCNAIVFALPDQHWQ